jgi:FKBP-type peptidyl-prolyl cis-trans isomerase FklB
MKMTKQLLWGLVGISSLFLMSFDSNPIKENVQTEYVQKADSSVTPELLGESFGVAIGSDLGLRGGMKAENLDFDRFEAEFAKVMKGEASEMNMQTANTTVQAELGKLMQAQQKGESVVLAPELSDALGFMIGTNLQSTWGERINIKSFMTGLKAGMGVGKASVDASTAQGIIQKETIIQQEKMAAEALAKEKPWFDENKKKNPNIQETASGIQYEILKKGEGRIPKASDKVKVHYHGTLTNGDIFDSSVDRGQPATFGVTQVIKGWQEVLQLMPVGSKWKVYIPSALAYGAQARPKIPANSILVFEIELLDIEKSPAEMEAAAKAKEVAWFAENKKNNPQLKVLDSGIQYEVLKEGDGEIPTAKSKVKTHYHGTLIDGTVFDSSVDRGEPISFPVNGVIQGWQQVLQQMKVGSKWRVYIPFSLAYGSRPAGKIPAYSTLIFEIELLGIE